MNSYKSPISYDRHFLTNYGYDVDEVFDYFLNIEWDERTSARREAFFSILKEPYSYGSGEFARTYHPRKMDYMVWNIGYTISADDSIPYHRFELCFLNRYDNERQALGWHADDSDSIDHTRPIAVISLGVEREIWIKPIGGNNSDVEKVLLHNGSLLIMRPGMQQTHLHRIPKHPAKCGTRISLTYRGLKL